MAAMAQRLQLLDHPERLQQATTATAAAAAAAAAGGCSGIRPASGPNQHALVAGPLAAVAASAAGDGRASGLHSGCSGAGGATTASGAVASEDTAGALVAAPGSSNCNGDTGGLASGSGGGGGGVAAGGGGGGGMRLLALLNTMAGGGGPPVPRKTYVCSVEYSLPGACEGWGGGGGGGVGGWVGGVGGWVGGWVGGGVGGWVGGWVGELFTEEGEAVSLVRSDAAVDVHPACPPARPPVTPRSYRPAPWRPDAYALTCTCTRQRVHIPNAHTRAPSTTSPCCSRWASEVSELHTCELSNRSVLHMNACPSNHPLHFLNECSMNVTPQAAANSSAYPWSWCGRSWPRT